MGEWPLRHRVPDFELGRLIQASAETEDVKQALLTDLEHLPPRRREEVAHRCWSSILRAYIRKVREYSECLVADAYPAAGDGADDVRPCPLVERLEQHMAGYLRRAARTLGTEPATLAAALAHELTSLLHPTLRDLSAAFIVGRLRGQRMTVRPRVGGRDDDIF
jgi:hypothetical protein